MLKIVQKIAKMTKIAQKRAKNIKKLLEKPKISTPVKTLALPSLLTLPVLHFTLCNGLKSQPVFFNHSHASALPGFTSLTSNHENLLLLASRCINNSRATLH